jgi:hypothetical protein
MHIRAGLVGLRREAALHGVGVELQDDDALWHPPDGVDGDDPDQTCLTISVCAIVMTKHPQN